MKVNLRLGDCIKMLPEIEDGSVDTIITDPPYFTSISSIGIKRNNALLNELRWEENFHWIKDAGRVLKPGGSLYVFCGDTFLSELRRKLEENGLHVFQRLHWIKANPMPSFTKRTYRGGVELALFCVKEGARNTFNIEKQADMRSVWNYPIVRGKERTVHPTQKPVPLLIEWIEDSTNPGETVLDPFMGSGSTGVACIRTDRNFIGMEISTEYYEIAQERIGLELRQLRMDL